MRKIYPKLYLDLDGVQCDFNGAIQKARESRFKNIEDIEEIITGISHEGSESVRKLFAELEPLSEGTMIREWCGINFVPFTVLSAPMRGELHASIQGKREWLDAHVPGSSYDALFTNMKHKFAMSDGTPNVLVDDYSPNLQAWTDAGGIAIKHRQGMIESTLEQLTAIYLK